MSTFLVYIQYYDNKTVLQWRLDMMGEFIFDECWSDRAKDMQTVLEFIKKHYTESEETPQITYSINVDEEIRKLEKKLDALIDMRAEGEITREEYNKKRTEYEEQIREQKAKKNVLNDAPCRTSDTTDLDRVIKALREISEDNHSELGQELMDKIVTSVVPHGNGMYERHLLTSPETETQVNLAVSGRANSKERPYVHLYGEEADNSASDLHTNSVVNFDCLRRFLHRLRSDNDRLTPFHTFNIGFDEAKAFRKATGSYLRENQWNDLKVDVYLEY